MNTLACNFASDAVHHSLDDLELTMIGTSIDDLQPDSDFPKRRFDQLQQAYGTQLALCEGGKNIATKLQSLSSGIIFYTKKQYENSLAAFQSISSPTSIEEVWTAAALTYQSRALRTENPARAKQMSIEAADRFEMASKLLIQELPDNNKSHVIQRQKCNSYMIRSRDDDKYAQEAEKCLADLLGHGNDDYNIEYDLAVIYVREQNFASVIDAVQKCLDVNTKNLIRKSDFDDDFAPILKDAQFGPKLQLLIQRFQP
jgi:tetratricopeptide (TPR) repeat protein